jgi:hypothetical protein
MKPQARCKHMTCNGLMTIEHDRIKCTVCGRSIWRNFEVRKSLERDQTTVGCVPGSRNIGGDKIKARI